MTSIDKDLTGRRIRVCHKTARIHEENDRSYTAEVELGGVIQNVVLSERYVAERLDDVERRSP